MKFQTVLLPNALYGSVWGASLSYNDTGILNMSGLVDYLYSILQPTPSGHLPCGLDDGIFVESAVIMSTKLNHEASRDEKRLRLRLNSIRQPVELQYGNFSTLHAYSRTKKHLNCSTKVN